MAKLEAMLEQRGVVTPREMSEAIARCQLHGGDLTTSLLQFVSADEAELSAVLSECYGLQAAPVGLLPAADDAASRSLPRDVAERARHAGLHGVRHARALGERRRERP